VRLFNSFIFCFYQQIELTDRIKRKADYFCSLPSNSSFGDYSYCPAADNHEIEDESRYDNNPSDRHFFFHVFLLSCAYNIA